MGIMVYSLYWVMQDFVHQPYEQKVHQLEQQASLMLNELKLVKDCVVTQDSEIRQLKDAVVTHDSDITQWKDAWYRKTAISHS